MADAGLRYGAVYRELRDLIMIVICHQCGAKTEKSASHANRANKLGANLYCDRICAGLSRRSKHQPTDAESKEAKRLYDLEYRAKNLAEIKAKKAAWFQRDYDPEQAAIKRKERMPYHVEYCRNPEYKAWKAEYDKQYLAKKKFGEFAEAALLLQEIEGEIYSRASRYEIYSTNGTLNKAQMRRRAL